eukprot:5049774-Prymnesium_polylepis.1
MRPPTPKKTSSDAKERPRIGRQRYLQDCSRGRERICSLTSRLASGWLGACPPELPIPRRFATSGSAAMRATQAMRRAAAHVLTAACGARRRTVRGLHGNLVNLITFCAISQPVGICHVKRPSASTLNAMCALRAASLP